jgi:hypothetical protein
MLASITPLGERGRRSRWGVTVTAFLLGATAAGVTLGSLAGLAGSAIAPHSEDLKLGVLAVGLALAVVLDGLPGLAPPGPRRQVNERWLDNYRGWVYGAGYGAQLGLGLTTIVTSAATYAALLAALLAGGPAGGAIVFGCFGLVRGATPLLAAGVRSPAALLALHAQLDRGRATVRWASTGTLSALLVLCAIGSLT